MQKRIATIGPSWLTARFCSAFLNCEFFKTNLYKTKIKKSVELLYSFSGKLEFINCFANLQTVELLNRATKSGNSLKLLGFFFCVKECVCQLEWE